MEFFPQIKRGGGFYVQINKVKRFLYCIILSAFYGQKIARSFFYVSVESDGGSTILSVLKHAVYNKFVTIVPITRIFIQNPPIWYDTFLLKKLLKKKKLSLFQQIIYCTLKTIFITISCIYLSFGFNFFLFHHIKISQEVTNR